MPKKSRASGRKHCLNRAPMAAHYTNSRNLSACFPCARPTSLDKTAAECWIMLESCERPQSVRCFSVSRDLDDNASDGADRLSKAPNPPSLRH